MAWFVLGLCLYYLVLLSERALIGVSPYDLEYLRNSELGSAIRAYRLITQLRLSLAALLLARMLLKILIVVCSTASLLRITEIHHWLAETALQTGLPNHLVWAIAAGAWIFILAIIFWGLKRLNWPNLGQQRARIGLQRLSRLIHFWTVLFRPFLPKKTTSGANASSDTDIPDGNAAVHLNPEKQRDIELLKSIVKFSDVTVKQVMQPRSKVVIGTTSSWWFRAIKCGCT